MTDLLSYSLNIVSYSIGLRKDRARIKLDVRLLHVACAVHPECLVASLSRLNFWWLSSRSNTPTVMLCTAKLITKDCRPVAFFVRRVHVTELCTAISVQRVFEFRTEMALSTADFTTEHYILD